MINQRLRHNVNLKLGGKMETLINEIHACCPIVVGAFNFICTIGAFYLLWLGLKAIINFVY